MDYSRITDKLFVGTTPKTEDFSVLRELEVQLVINMRIGLPPKRDRHSVPIRSLWLPAIDSPLFPIPLSFLEAGAEEALKVMENGGAVYTHCAKGRHRGPAMGACILVAQGLTPDEAMRLIKTRRPAADPQAWYIRRRIEKFARKWEAEYSK
jgi:protein-tyrosine phosphatase